MNGASGKAAPAKAQQQQSSSKRQRPSKLFVDFLFFDHL